MPPTQCHTGMEGQRRKILSRYCDVLQCFLSPERFLAFSSVAKVPLQALNELRHRAPLPQLAMDLGFLQQLGVVGKTVKLDLQARYYVDLHSCKNALQERVSQILYLIESKPEHLKWAWQDATVYETLPHSLLDAPTKRQALMRVLDRINKSLAQIELESVSEKTQILRMRPDQNSSCLMDSVEMKNIEAAKITHSRYGILAKPWISFRPQPGDDNAYKLSSIKLLQWMESEVWKERVEVSLEEFFKPHLHFSYIRQVLNLLIVRGETLLAPVLVKDGLQTTYTVLDERVVDCVLDHCIMAGLSSERGAALCLLVEIQKVVKEKLLLGVSLGQVRRVVKYLHHSDFGFKGITHTTDGAEAVMWVTPIWLRSKTHFHQYLETQTERGQLDSSLLW